MLVELVLLCLLNENTIYRLLIFAHYCSIELYFGKIFNNWVKIDCKTRLKSLTLNHNLKILMYYFIQNKITY